MTSRLVTFKIAENALFALKFVSNIYGHHFGTQTDYTTYVN